MKSLRGREAKEKFIKEYENVKVLTYAVFTQWLHENKSMWWRIDR